MSRRSDSRPEKFNDDYKKRPKIKRSSRSRSRSPLSHHSSYGITSESYSSNRKQRSDHHRHFQPSSLSSSSSKSNGFIPDEETKKFYEKPTGSETGFWTSEDYTFRDMIAKDVRNEIEDDIASKGSDEESEVDSELADYADRADLDDDDDDEQKKTIVERLIPMKKDEENSKHLKTDQVLARDKSS
ncbi:unnamed protein product [Adineta ricciae]|uniref:Uncharacterized protein n=1 Tax=Adineta ricciae TaxID=249248 RepID=A0A814BJ99_ADIRI|nr:unnamed protein product [Adineta ricciae]CAF0963618.1 unnamed protein product [Adineta ricciae]